MGGKSRPNSIIVNASITTATDTQIAGLLKGEGGKVKQALPGTDFATPASVDTKMTKVSNLADLENRQTALNNLTGGTAANALEVLTKDNDGNVKFLPQASSGGSSDVLTYDFPLNETITADKIVQLLTTGKIEPVKSVPQTETVPNGTATQYTTTGTIDPVVNFDPNNPNRFVVAFTESFSSNYGAIRAGTISGTTITFGTKLTFNWSDTQMIDIDFCKNPANTIVIVYRDVANYGYGTARVATIASNLTITIGNPTVVYSANMQQIRVACTHSVSDKGFIVIQPDGTPYIYYMVFTISGTTITVTSPSGVYVGTSYTYFTMSASRKDPIAVIAFTYGADSAVMPLSMNATGVPSHGLHVTALASASAGVVEVDMTGATNDFIVVYRNASGHLKAKTGTVAYAVTAATITLNTTENTITSKNVTLKAIAGDYILSGKYFLVYTEYSAPNWYTRSLTLTSTGATVTVGTERTIVALSPTYRLSATISWGNAGQVLIVRDSHLEQALMGLQLSNINKPNILGFLKVGGVANDIRTVKLLGGVVTGFTGLTPGTNYYIQPDGTVSATSSDSRCAYLGKAISATAILSKQI